MYKIIYLFKTRKSLVRHADVTHAHTHTHTRHTHTHTHTIPPQPATAPISTQPGDGIFLNLYSQISKTSLKL